MDQAEDGKSKRLTYTPEEKDRFRNDPDSLLNYRKTLESKMGKKFNTFLRGTQDSKNAKRIITEDMLRKIGPGHDELKKKLIPTWSPGCRRMTVRLGNPRPPPPA
jgi:hypothetical protein